MSKIKINDIPVDRKLTGYLWLSNKQTPRVLEDCSIEQSNEQSKEQPDGTPAVLKDGVNPFIVEAELWDADSHVAYAIHHAGNEVVCQRYEVKAEDLRNPDNNEVVFLSHRMGDRELHFLEYWEPKRTIGVVDINGKPDGKGMPTLVMTRRVFIGFTPLYNKEEQA